MGLHKGQKAGGVGKKGLSGRKSAYQENADQKYLVDLWFKKHTKEEITELLSVAGEHSMSDAWLARGLAGNVDIQKAVFNKLFPDTLNLSLVKPLPIGSQTKAKIKELYGIKRNNLRKDNGTGKDESGGSAGSDQE